MKLTFVFVALVTITIFSACTTIGNSGNPQLAMNSLVSTNCTACQKDHYEYKGPYQFAVGNTHYQSK